MILRIVKALVLCGFIPRRIAIENATTPFRAACLAHWIGLIPSAFALACLLLVDRETAEDTAELLSRVSTSPALWVWGVGLVLLVELLFLLLALMLVPWGDSLARARSLSTHALRTVWLHTGHVGLAGGIYGTMQVFCDNCLYPMRFQQGPMPQWLAGSQFGQAAAEYYWAALPPLFTSCAIWVIWALLRAVTADIHQPEPVRPPLCENCGYNLASHLADSDRCPECGRMTRESLDCDRRGPVHWRFVPTGGRQPSFAGTSLAAWFKPDSLFTRVSPYFGMRQAGLFLLAYVLLTGIAFSTAAGIGLTQFVFDENFGPDSMPVFIYFITWPGLLVAFVAACGACLVAAVIGLVVSRREGRNCVGGAFRVACYCMAIVPLWTFCQMLALFAVVGYLSSLEGNRPPWTRRLPVGFVVLIASLCAIYAVAVARRMRFVRYANH